MSKPNKALIGSAGVHFVCGELSRHGYVALPTIRNTPGIDVIARSPLGSKIEIQVKTSWNKDEWVCPVESKIHVKHDFYFIFVNLKAGLENPAFYIVPSEIVREQVEEGFKAWRETPGKNGSEHSRDNTMRLFPVPANRFVSEAFKKRLKKPLELNRFKKWTF